MKIASALRQVLLSTLFLSFALVLPADELDVWKWRNPAPAGSSLFAVTFGASRFVAAGESGIVGSSPDGVNWTAVDAGVTNAVYAMTFGGNLFVSVGDQGTIFTSFDGMLWTARDSGTTNRLTGVAYGNGIYVAVGAGSTALVSTNGRSWTAQTLSNIQPVDIAFGNGLFVVTTTGYSFATTRDGINWNSVGLPGTSGQFSGVVFGNNTFVAGAYTIGGGGGLNPLFWVSTNGSNWTQGSAFAGIPRPVTYGNGVFVSTAGTVIGTSTNGLNWTVRTNTSLTVNQTYIVLGAGTFGNGTFLLAGGGGFTLLSTNAVNWYTPNTSRDLLTDIEYANGLYVAVGGFYAYPAGTYGPVPGPTLLTSTNGRSFVPLASGISHPLSSIAVGNGCFVAVGTGGGLYRSTNGLNWVRRGSGTTRNLQGVTYGGGMFVIVGEEGTIATSPDGLTWTLRFSGSAYPLYDVTYSNNRYVVVGYFGTILTSSDATAWTVQPTDTPNALLSVVGGAELFVAVGQGGTILTSSDGVDWIPRESGVSLELSAVTFGNGIFLAAGENGPPTSGLASTNAVLSSTDGVNWVRRNPRTNSRLRGVAYLNGAYWLVGENGAILESGGPELIQLFGQWDAGDAAFELRSTGGQIGRVYQLQKTANFGGDWSDLSDCTNTSAGIYFLDRDSYPHSNCFYRLMLP